MSVPPRRILPYLRPLPSFRHKTLFTIQSIFSGRLLPGKGGYFWFQFQGCFRCLPLQIDYHFAQPQFLQFLFFCFERAALGISQQTTFSKSCHLQKQEFSFGFFVGSMLGPLHCDIEVSPVEITLLPFFPRCNAPPAHTKTLPSILSSPTHLESSTPAPDQQMGPLFSQGLLAFILLPYLLPHAVSVRYCFSCH